MQIARPDNAKPQGAPTGSSQASDGPVARSRLLGQLLDTPVPHRRLVRGRTDLASKGIQFGLKLNQYVQGVTNGGRDRTVEYGGTVDYTLNVDLMRMGVLPGALIKFRAESRYGSSVNGAAGPILPVNTDALFPLTDTLDEDIPLNMS